MSDPDAEVPFDEEGFTVGVVDDPIVVASKLRIVSGNELQSSQRSLTKLFDQVSIAEVALDFPMRGDGAEVDDPDMAQWFGGSRKFKRCGRHGDSNLSKGRFIGGATTGWCATAGEVSLSTFPSRRLRYLRRCPS